MAGIRADMARSAAEMKDFRSQIHKATSQAPELDRVLEETQNVPFTSRITRAVISDPGKMKITAYEGKGDPRQHLTAFAVAMGRASFREGEKDAGQCLLFVENLKGSALQWFSRLPPNSIDSFKELTAAFLKQYAIYIERRTSDADLWTIAQGEHESLRSFLDRFREVLSRMEGVNDTAALQALEKAVWFDSDFQKEIALHPPTTIQDALHRGTVHARYEEKRKTIAQKLGKTKNPSPAPTQTQPAAKKANQGSGFVQHEGEFQGAHNYQVDSPTNERGRGNGDRGSGQGRGSWNNTWNQSENTYDKTFYCEFHKTHSHSTANCRTLGSLLAQKFAEGKLGEDISIADLADEYTIQREQMTLQQNINNEDEQQPLINDLSVI